MTFQRTQIYFPKILKIWLLFLYGEEAGDVAPTFPGIYGQPSSPVQGPRKVALLNWATKVPNEGPPKVQGNHGPSTQSSSVCWHKCSLFPCQLLPRAPSCLGLENSWQKDAWVVLVDFRLASPAPQPKDRACDLHLRPLPVLNLVSRTLCVWMGEVRPETTLPLFMHLGASFTLLPDTPAEG